MLERTLLKRSHAAILTLTLALFVAVPALADWDAGVAAFRSGDLEAAENAFRKVVEAQPDWPSGHQMLGRALAKQGRADDAITSLKRAVELDPGDLVASLTMAQLELDLERWDAAGESLAAMKPESLPAPQAKMVYGLRAKAAKGVGDVAAEADALSHAVKLSPDSASLHRQAARAADAAGRAGAALTYWRRAAELAPMDAKAQLGLVDALYRRARAAPQDARAARCAEVLGPGRRLLAVKQDAAKHATALRLFTEAARCAERDDEAIAPLSAAAKARPDDWWPPYALGRAQLSLERWDEATASFGKALERAVPADEESRVIGRLAYARERRGDYTEAIKLYRQAGDTVGAERAAANLKADQLAELEERERQVRESIRELENPDG